MDELQTRGKWTFAYVDLESGRSAWAIVSGFKNPFEYDHVIIEYHDRPPMAEAVGMLEMLNLAGSYSEEGQDV